MYSSITLEELLKKERLKQGNCLTIPIDKNRRYMIPTEHSGVSRNQYFNNINTTLMYCRYTGSFDRGVIKCVGEISEFEVALKGRIGYEFGIHELHKLCFSLYSLQEHGITAYSMTEKEWYKFKSTIRGKNKEFWLASKHINVYSIYCSMDIYYASLGYMLYANLYDNDSKSEKYKFAICPIILLDIRNRVITDEYYNGIGSKRPYKIVL